MFFMLSWLKIFLSHSHIKTFHYFTQRQDYEKFAERSGANLGKCRAEAFSS